MGASPHRDAILTNSARSLIQFKARQLTRRNGFSQSDEEDLVQELTLRLLQKAHLYDPSRGASINTFADRVVHSAVKMILRDRRRQKRAAGYTAVSLESSTVDVDDRPVALGDLLSTTDQQRRALTEPHLSGDDRDAVRHAIETLPPELAEIAQRLKEASVASVARALGVSRRQLYASIAQIRQHFEEAGFGNL